MRQKEENNDLNTKISAFQHETCLEPELFPWEIDRNDWQVLPVEIFTNTQGLNMQRNVQKSVVQVQGCFAH